jgi:putative glutamine amidotransferase
MPATKRLPRIGITSRFVAGDGVGAGSSSVDRLATVDANNQLIARYDGLILGLPMLRELDGAKRAAHIAAYVDQLDGLLLQGGTDIAPQRYGQTPLRPAWAGDPIRDRLEFDVLEAFLRADKPVLGVCRGFQVLQVMFGGALLQDIPTQHAGAIAHDSPAGYCACTHAVELMPAGPMAQWYGRSSARVNSAHHQGVLAAAGGLQVDARAPDGIIEALYAPAARFVYAVQWHPEFHHLDAALLDPSPMLRAFIAACAC